MEEKQPENITKIQTGSLVMRVKEGLKDGYSWKNIPLIYRGFSREGYYPGCPDENLPTVLDFVLAEDYQGLKKGIRISLPDNLEWQEGWVQQGNYNEFDDVQKLLDDYDKGLINFD